MPEELKTTPELAGGAEGLPRRESGDRRWIHVASAILAVGLAVSLAGALFWRANVRSQNRRGFQANATYVSEALQTLLRRDADFEATLRAVMTMQPHMTARGFDEWFAQLNGSQRQAGGLGTNVVVPVGAAQLTTFEARRAADPAFRAFVGGKLVPVPRSGRARYCLLEAGGTGTPYTQEIGELVEGDWCNPSSPIGGYPAGQTSQALLMPAITDSGRSVVYNARAQGVSTLFIEAAFYRRAAPLASVAQRRAALAGWVSSSFQIEAVISQAIAGHRDISVALYHRNPGQPEEFISQVGAAPSTGDFTHDTTMQIDGMWRAVVRGSTGEGPTADVQGLLVLIAGLVVSALLSALIVVLARSRERAFGMVHDKTKQLRHQAFHDALTGLPNRVLALDRAEQMLARTRRQSVPLAALYVDLDGFKHVNDTFGHAAGDEVLRIVAARLTTVIREGDTAARLGGDEFIVLLEGSTLDAGPELVAERLLAVLNQPYELSDTLGRRLSVSASVGIAVGARATADELFRDADLALYQAKASGHDRYALFEPSMQTASHDRLLLEMDLAEALEREQLFLLYQPIVDLRTEAVIGLEALLRWRHPTRGIIAPLDFIPIANDSGLIVPIGRWVLGEACRQASAWHRPGREIGLSVNVAALQLDSDELIEDVRSALQENDLRPASLTLEITETALMRDAEAAARRLGLLKRLGVRIAIDDFGTGYSSLAYLRRFPADALKIDGSFVGGTASKASVALISTFVQLGKALDLETVAEGIEDQASLDVLKRAHCDHGQGFLFSRPLPVGAIEEFLDAKLPVRPVAVS
jgi:diguanylate cyclase (GGDEF)-like protein